VAVSFRDPDLGRDRTTAALGKRDWGFFDGSGVVPADYQPGEAPWESLRHVSTHDRFDRTLGIPERRVSMWPLEARAAGPPGEHARAICDQLLAERGADRRWPEAPVAVVLLADIAARVYGQTAARQRETIAAAAGRFGVDPPVAFELAGGVGALIAQTAHRKAPELPGLGRLNLLAGAQLDAAVELFLARDLIRHAQAHSDPDLPRLWMLANGLAHGIAVSVMRAVPARSVGPAARIVPLHEDLVDWQAMRVAVEHMDATVAAAAAGRSWLDGLSRLAGADDAARALGVVALTQPTLAATMARHGPAQVTLQRARLAAGPTPPGCSTCPTPP
jgi:hypothetical protein